MANPYLPSGDLVISAGDCDWFLHDLSRQYHAAAVRISTEGPITGEARDCQLDHISSQPDGIVFFMMCDQANETRYVIANPESVVAHRDESGTTESLTIVALDGSVTRVWFGEAVARSEEVNIAA
jgi:hypothetical protein